MKLVLFGAGNIGRSFVGALFSNAGWDVVFADTAQNLVSLLNEKRCYTVVIKREGKADERRVVGPVRALDGRDFARVAEELADCDLAATSVGKDALPKIMPVIAEGLRLRKKPLDIIIAENARDAKSVFLEGIQAALADKNFPLEDMLGLVETSIGKMVPLVTQQDLAEDPLRLFAEEYETLIVDRRAFHGDPPAVAGLKPVEHIAAWVDRKLFVHNLGHAAAAYLGYAANPGVVSISEALRLAGVQDAVRAAMNAAADALALEYTESYTRAELAAHIGDLLFRFANSALGDTVFRVGRDIRRKLAENDRVSGAMLLCARRGVNFDPIAGVYRAALGFKATGENGKLFPADEAFFRDDMEGKTAGEALASPMFLSQVSGLDDSTAEKRIVREALLRL
jgi:mannitol-1-phosphate 5-dehydrogenase